MSQFVQSIRRCGPEVWGRRRPTLTALEGLPSVGLQLARSAELHCQWVACDFPWFELTARP